MSGIKATDPAAARAEIERRVERLAEEIASELGSGHDGAPRWISPADLVRRVQPLLSDN